MTAVAPNTLPGVSGEPVMHIKRSADWYSACDPPEWATPERHPWWAALQYGARVCICASTSLHTPTQ